MKNVSPPSVGVPEVVGMIPAAPLDYAVIHGSAERNGDGKAEKYRAACKTTADLAAARKKCRDLIDLALRNAPQDVVPLARAMIEVGAAASRDLGDGSRMAFLLGHLGRRIREGGYFDF